MYTERKYSRRYSYRKNDVHKCFWRILRERRCAPDTHDLICSPSAPGSRSDAAGGCGSPPESDYCDPEWRSFYRFQTFGVAAPAPLCSTGGALHPWGWRCLLLDFLAPWIQAVLVEIVLSPSGVASCCCDTRCWSNINEAGSIRCVRRSQGDRGRIVEWCPDPMPLEWESPRLFRKQQLMQLTSRTKGGIQNKSAQIIQHRLPFIVLVSLEKWR